jgi:hypothetical protein
LAIYPQVNIDAALRHFAAASDALEVEDWDKCIGKCGKFVEAAIKAVGGYAAVSAPLTGKHFSVGTVIDHLDHKTDKTKFPDSVRLTIPRLIRFVYDVASNRGARHDASEIDSNRMDAIACQQSVSWILAEMIRLSQKGALHPDEAAAVVEGLMEKRYPDVEDVDGRLYIHQPKLSGREIALRVLERVYPKRMHRQELIKTLRRHHETQKNAERSVERIAKFVDPDSGGNLYLLANGRQEAEKIRAKRKK